MGLKCLTGYWGIYLFSITAKNWLRNGVRPDTLMPYAEPDRSGPAYARDRLEHFAIEMLYGVEQGETHLCSLYP